jgi:hypothetical protein
MSKKTPNASARCLGGQHRWLRRCEHDDIAGWTLRYECESCGCWGRVGRKDQPGQPVAYKRMCAPSNDFGGAALLTVAVGLDPFAYANDCADEDAA